MKIEAKCRHGHEKRVSGAYDQLKVLFCQKQHTPNQGMCTQQFTNLSLRFTSAKEDTTSANFGKCQVIGQNTNAYSQLIAEAYAIN